MIVVFWRRPRSSTDAGSQLSGRGRLSPRIFDKARKLADLPRSRFATGIYQNDGLASGERRFKVSRYRFKNVRTQWLKVNGRVFDYLNMPARIPALKPLLKERPCATFFGRLEGAGKRIEREFAQAIRLTSEQRHD